MGMCFSNQELTQLHDSYKRRADTGVNEGGDAAESAALRVARKQTDKCRAAEELAKKALLPLPRNMLPILPLLNTKRRLMLRMRLHIRLQCC